MHPAGISASADVFDSPPGATDAPVSLSTVVYRSRSVAPMSPRALHALIESAQARNSRENITGLMLYDGGWFFQCLEGPTRNVSRVMNAIYRDPRHTDIEVLESRPVQARAFGDWSMRLAARIPDLESWRRDVLDPPRDVLEAIHQRPQAAPALLIRLAQISDAAADDASGADATREMPLNRKTEAILKRVILTTVIPTVMGVGATAPLGAIRPTNARASELAELLIAADQGAAMELIQSLHGGPSATAGLYTALMEPAARILGDLWNDDLCSDFDLTVGLCRLQTAIRLITVDSARALPSRLVQPAVLIVPEPGELHRLGAALDNNVLDRAGWSPHCEYPADDRALQDILASTWFDVLDLSLSIALRHEQFLPRLAQTIAQARRASRNPALVVVVGGRVFFETSAAGANVGADLTSTTSGNVDTFILKTLSETRTNAAAGTVLPQVMATPS